MALRETDLNAEIRGLYQGPLDDFTASRNALAVRLRKEKRAEDSAAVKALPKPTPSTWAVNLLFERQPEKMDALLGAGKLARTAQGEAVSGRAVESLRETIRSARGLADELRWDAAQILADRGRPPGRELVERIAANLQALAFSPAAAGEAARRWLDRDLDPPGFEVLAGLQLAGAPVVDFAARKAQQEAKKEEEKKPDGETKREEEGRRKREAAEQARQEREAEQLRRRIAVAEEKAAKARSEARALLEEAETAENAAAEARTLADRAEQAASRARDKADKAAERLAHAEDAVRAAREGEP